MASKNYLNWKKLAKIDETLWHLDLIYSRHSLVFIFVPNFTLFLKILAFLVKNSMDLLKKSPRTKKKFKDVL